MSTGYRARIEQRRDRQTARRPREFTRSSVTHYRRRDSASPSACGRVRDHTSRSLHVTARLTVAAAMIAASASVATAQPQGRPRIAVSVEARTEGLAEPDATAAQLLAEVRRALGAP